MLKEIMRHSIIEAHGRNKIKNISSVSNDSKNIKYANINSIFLVYVLRNILGINCCEIDDIGSNIF